MRPISTQGTRYLTAAELAARYRVSRESVLSWHRQGLIPGVRLGIKAIRFDPDAVAAALESESHDSSVKGRPGL